MLSALAIEPMSGPCLRPRRAQGTTVETISDLSGKPEAERFRKSMSRYVGKGRKVTAKRSSRKVRSTSK